MKMLDAVGVELHVGDTVHDYSFKRNGIITGFDFDELVLVHFNDYKNISVPKNPWNLISLEPHKITNPEIFL